MSLFSYRAINDDNKEVRGSIDAISLDAAKEALSKQNIDFIDISEATHKRDEPVLEAPEPSLKSTFAFEGTDALGAVHRGVVEADTKYQAFERLKKDQKLLLTMLSPVGVTPQYRDNDLMNWQRKEMMAGSVAVPVIRSASVPPPVVPISKPETVKKVGFSLPEAPAKLISEKNVPETPPASHNYAPIFSTLRLYAGWLLAWYGLFVAIGYYSFVRWVPVDIPFVQAFFLSPLIFTFIVAIFIFLMLTNIHRSLKGGIASGIMMTIIGMTIFIGVRMNI